MSERSFSRPKRALGQNFLVDGKLQRRIVAALGAGPEDEVVEIGPGRGALTRHLMGRVGRLVLVELDDALAQYWAAEATHRPSVRVVHGDVMEVDFRRELERPAEALVVGNIPYNITSPLIFRLLERPRPRRVLLMVQEEVARRLVAPPGTKSYGALSVGVQSVARVRRLFGVGRKAFRPVPRVDSAVVEIEPFRPEPLSAEAEERLRGLVRAAFQWRRKQLRKILLQHPELGMAPQRADALLTELGVSPAARPETLSPEEFIALSEGIDG